MKFKKTKKRDKILIAETIASYRPINNLFSEIINRIIQGDNLSVLKLIPAYKINLVITSPPYFKQRDYGGGIGNEKTINEYIENLLLVFSECVRILKDDGSIVFNLGDKYLESNLQLIPYRFAISVLEKFPVKLINNVTWVKLNPTPRQYQRRLVSSTEPFFHFVKSKEYYYNFADFMNNNGAKNKRTNGNNIGKKYFELIESSSLTLEQKKMALCELQEVIEEVRAGKIESFRMKIRGIHSEPFGGQDGGRKYQLMRKGFTIIKIKGEPIKRDVIGSAVETIKGCKHPAIYPLYIIKELIRLLSRPGEIILDPFIGSGTTAVAAKELGRRYIGIDINEEYCKYAKLRLENSGINKPQELFI
ncbi:MAG: site-specific DNA-methyltransferase [Thermodesulfovibrionales bacterium]|nr:site-specific DNA-methyltransferase [Thermodesulfovibrionales bacterium]